MTKISVNVTCEIIITCKRTTYHRYQRTKRSLNLFLPFYTKLAFRNPKIRYFPSFCYLKMPHVGKLKKSTFLQPYLEELLIIMIRIVINSNHLIIYFADSFDFVELKNGMNTVCHRFSPFGTAELNTANY